MTGQIPKYRVLWTWDYCTFLDDSLYVRGLGAAGFNNRRSHFLKDYKRMVDYCVALGINGIVIWGALRSYENGLEQFKELVKYGKEKGVRILPGAGVFGYGGIHYDTRKSSWVESPVNDSDYSLQSWLTKYPELLAIGQGGKPVEPGIFSAVACPSKKENKDWFKHAFEWLFTEFQVDGAQIEVGDYAVCYCEDCTKKRLSSEGSVFQVEDMIEPYTEAVNIATKINPDAWVICETYSSFATPKPGDKPNTFGSTFDFEQKKLLEKLPSNAIVQWVLDRAVGYNPSQIWERDIYLPTENNISRIHAGSQWHINSVDSWAVYTIGDMVKKARSCGVNGVSIFGEESPASPPNEANYLVFSEFFGLNNENPGCDLELFYKNTLDPLYGGSGMAKEWRRIYITAHMMRLDFKDPKSLIENSQSFNCAYHEIGKLDLLTEICNMSTSEKQKMMIKLSQEVHDISSKMSGEICRRWVWLENWLWRAEFLHRTNTWD